MICRKCGNQLPDGALVCNNCGERVVPEIIQVGEVGVTQSVVEQPMVGNSIVMPQGNVGQTPVMQQPVVEQPVVGNSVVMPQGDVGQTPVMQQPVVEQPVVGNSIAMPQGNVGQIPVMQQPVVEQPVVGNSVVMPQENVISQPLNVVQDVVAPQVISQEQVVQVSNPGVQDMGQIANGVMNPSNVQVPPVQAQMGEVSQVVVPQPDTSVGVINNQGIPNQMQQGVPQQQVTGVQGDLQQSSVQGQPTQVQSAPVAAPKKKSSPIAIVIIIVGLIILGYMAYGWFFKGNNSNGVSVGTDTGSSAGTVGDVTSSETSQQDVTVNGYTLTFPSDLEYDLDGDYLVYTDSGKTMVNMLTIGNDDFDKYLNDTNILSDMLKENNITATYASKSYSDLNFLTYQYHDDEKNLDVIFYVSKVNDSSIIAGFMYKGSNFSENDSFDSVVKMIQSVQGDSSSSFTISIPSISSDGKASLFLEGLK